VFGFNVDATLVSYAPKENKPQSRTSGRKVHSVPWKKTTLYPNPALRGIKSILAEQTCHPRIKRTFKGRDWCHYRQAWDNIDIQQRQRRSRSSRSDVWDVYNPKAYNTVAEGRFSTHDRCYGVQLLRSLVWGDRQRARQSQAVSEKAWRGIVRWRGWRDGQHQVDSARCACGSNTWKETAMSSMHWQQDGSTLQKMCQATVHKLCILHLSELLTDRHKRISTISSG
jgi:hypothetical protein